MMRRFNSYFPRFRPKDSSSATAQASATADQGSASAQASATSQAALKSQHQDPPPTQSQQPAPQAAPVPMPTGATLNIALQNQTTSNTVYAYITGQALDRGNARFLLSADGRTPHYPTSPASVGSHIETDCAIPLGSPGHTTTVTVPHTAGGRIWFSIDAKLTFLLNPGPAIVEPSVTNNSDPNANIDWGFAEFTFNTDQLYANISYVDFVGPPVALTLTTQSGQTQHVSGMPSNGLDKICDGLRAQHAADGQGWDQLIVQHNGRNLRALSPNQGMVTNNTMFTNYFDNYISRAWAKFASTPISIDTQASFGKVSATIDKGSGTLKFGGASFTRPSTKDIFTCSTGPFATGGDAQTNAIIPRLAAAFNRSTLLATDDFPAPLNLYYKEPITNHYSRIVHSVNLDGKGYAFPYDDVQPSGGADQSGEVHAGDPKLFTVAVGGGNASVNPEHGEL